MASLKLIIFRHGESPSYSADSDHARTLNGRGRAQARRTAAALAAAGHRPDEVLCSDSERTRQTWDEASTSFPDLAPVLSRSLYLADLLQMRDAVESLREGIEVGLILGHNPGVSQLVGWLSGEGLSMSTATAAVLTCEADSWAVASHLRDGWRLAEVLRPEQ